MSEDDRTLRELVKRIKEGKVAVFTGAGMSTESGLPDFRSQGGLWDGKDPMEVASTQAFTEDFETFTDFYRYRLKEIERFSPHAGHRILAEWERRGWVDAVMTQNIDGYHTEAGSKRVYEIHGSLTSIYCHRCRTPIEKETYAAQNRCECGGKIRPGIVLFGEALPMQAFQHAIEAAATCRTMLVIGTSLQVAPANMLPQEAKRNGASIYMINRDPVEDPWVDGWIAGGAGDTLKTMEALLND